MTQNTRDAGAAALSPAAGRILLLGIGRSHYETRSVEAADWLGIAETLDRFFSAAADLLGSRLRARLEWEDGEVALFRLPTDIADSAEESLREAVDALALDLALETPPLLLWGDAAAQADLVALGRRRLLVPWHRPWRLLAEPGSGHTCPICLVRRSPALRGRQQLCSVCAARRRRGRFLLGRRLENLPPRPESAVETGLPFFPPGEPDAPRSAPKTWRGETGETSFQTFRYFAATADPVALGEASGLARDPATFLPYLPAPFLAAALRRGVARAFGKEATCGGAGGPAGSCGLADCPVCTVFGFLREQQAGGLTGLAAVGDARLLLFPLTTPRGPFWVGSPATLRQMVGLAGLPLPQPTAGQVLTNTTRARLAPWGLAPRAGGPAFSAIADALAAAGLPADVRENIGLVSGRDLARLLEREAPLPARSYLSWELFCRSPRHFLLEGLLIGAVRELHDVEAVVACAFPFLAEPGLLPALLPLEKPVLSEILV